MIKDLYPKCIGIKIEVKTYDIDTAGHVNNIVYMRWLEDMRNELFSKIYPLKKLLEINYYPVIISTELKYKRQLKLFDEPVGRIFMESNSHGIIILNAEICINDNIAFTANQKCVLMNLATHKMYMGNIQNLLKELKMSLN
jgi:acyl-CoA thioester hydrolase